MLNEPTVTYQWLLFIFAVVTVLLPILGGRFSIPSFPIVGSLVSMVSFWSNFCLYL